MAKLPDLVARVRLDTSKLDASLTHVNRKFDGVGKHFDGVSGRMGQGIGRLGRVTKTAFAGVGLGIAAGLAGATALLKGAFDEATEARKVAAQTAATLKSTGGVARVSAKHFDALTTAISNKVGIDDEAIATGGNLLLTFTNIRNQVGKNNNIFDQATAAAVDMSVALGTDVTSAATQLGKALHDPAKGAAALSKAGSLAKDDLKKLKDMAAAGVPVLEQQKFILNALAIQYGGSAAAAATPMAKLSVIMGNLKEDIGTALLPVVDKAATWLGARLPGAVEKAQAFFKGRLVPAFGAVRGFISDQLVPAFDAVRGFIEEKLLPAVQRFIAWFQENVLPNLQIAAGIFRDKLGGAIESVTGAIERNKGNLQALGEFIATKVIPVLVVVAGIIAQVLGGAITVAITVISGLVGWFRDLWDIAKKVVKTIGDVADKISNLPGAGIVKKGLGLLGFAQGGVVPGPIGAPQLAVVHGGERVIPNGGGGGGGGGGMTVNQNIYGGQSPDDIARAIAWQGRR